MNEIRRRTPWLLVMLLCVLLLAHILFRLYYPRLQAPTDAEVATAIRLVLDNQVGAWNKGDLEGFMKGYWRSNDLKFYSGKDITSGWDATLERYKNRYQSEGREMGQLTFSDLEIKQIGDSDAWARGRWRVVTSRKTLEGLFTLIFHRGPDGWRIIHDHTSAHVPPPTKATP